MPTRLKKLTNRINGLSKKSEPQEINLIWYNPAPLEPDEELVIIHEEPMGRGTFRIVDKRKKK